MTTEFVRLTPAMTVADALGHVRTVAGESESIYACYVLDGNDRLLVAVSLRDLVMAEPSRLVSDIMRRHPLTAGVADDRADVARKIAKYNLLAVPVLEADGRVVGFVTVDDVIDVLVEEQTDQVLRMGGVEAGASTTRTSARRSCGWFASGRRGSSSCSSARCLPRRPWGSSNTRSPRRSCSRCSSR